MYFLAEQFTFWSKRVGANLSIISAVLAKNLSVEGYR